MPIIKRSVPSKKSSAASYRELLRNDFKFSCAFCRATEADMPDFDIEHYLPQTKFPKFKDNFLNLLWACGPCNRNKGDFYPGISGFPKGFFLLRPDRFDFDNHFYYDNHQIHGKTKVAEFTIDFLMLNRDCLKTLQKKKDLIFQKSQLISHLLAQILNTSIDDVGKNAKGILLQQKAKALEIQKIQKDLQTIVPNPSQSFFLNRDPDKKILLEKRRKHRR